MLLRSKHVTLPGVAMGEFNLWPSGLGCAGSGTCSYLENFKVIGWMEWILTAGVGAKARIQEYCTCTHSGPRQHVSKGLEWAQKKTVCLE